jgi:hypothetical protein
MKIVGKDMYLLKYKKGESAIYRERDQFSCELDEE